MAVNKYIHIARKLQTACKKLFGIKLLIDQKQWYHKDRDSMLTVYTLYQVNIDEEKQSKIKLFQTYSQIQLVLYMRDLWYKLNGWEIPTDNKTWMELKQRYGEKKEPSEETPTSNNIEQKWRTECNRTAICDELYTGWKRNRSSQDDSRIAEEN